MRWTRRFETGESTLNTSLIPLLFRARNLHYLRPLLARRLRNLNKESSSGLSIFVSANDYKMTERAGNRRLLKARHREKEIRN